jgi:act minimal PKS chain-length factor (CLF/KS beta)
MAVIAPNGSTTEKFWQATVDGVTGIRPLTFFDAAGYPVRVAGEVPDFVASDLLEGRIIAQTDRWTQFGLVAAGRAIGDAGLVLSDVDSYEISVVTAAASGGNEFGQREIQKLWHQGPRHLSPYQSIAWFYAAATGQISIGGGMKGACGVLVAEQAGGLSVLAQARRTLREDARMVITGGTEAPLGPYAITCQASSGLLSDCDEAARAYLPFDADASGYVPGEGGAMFVVERDSYSRRLPRGRAYGQLAGYADTFDPRPGSGREPGLRRAITQALDDARIGPQDVDVVFADGLAIPSADRQEAAAINAVFAPRAVPVTAPQCLVGRLHAGGAPLQVAMALLAIRDQLIPGTVSLSVRAPGCQLDIVRETREAPVRTALVLARGYGGFNAAAVISAL